MFNQLYVLINSRTKHAWQSFVSLALMAPTMLQTKLFADDTYSKIKEAMGSGQDAGAAISNATGFVLQVAIWAGGMILLWGTVMFAFSVKNDDPEAKQKSTYVIVTGIVLLTIRTLFASIFV